PPHALSQTRSPSPRADLRTSRNASVVIEAIWQHIARAVRPWDVFEIADVASESRTLAPLLEAARGSGCRAALWRAGASPYIDAGTSWPDYLASRSRNFRKEIRRKDRRLAGRGQLELIVVTDSTEVRAA